MKPSKIAALLVAGWVLLSIAAVAAAQTPSYSLSGKVVNSDNSDSISGASLHFQNTMTSFEQYATTDNGGHYSVTLDEGNYDVTVTADGFEDQSESIYIGSDQNRGFQLTPNSGSGDGTGSDSGNPFGNIDTSMLNQVVFIILMLVIIFFICLITITIALVAMFVRLGKVRKELGEINKNLDDLRKPAVPQQSVYQQQQYYPQPPQSQVQQQPPTQ